MNFEDPVVAIIRGLFLTKYKNVFDRSQQEALTVIIVEAIKAYHQSQR